MTMEINNIGNNAGVIWNVLNANGKMTESKLKKESGLGSAEFYSAMRLRSRAQRLASTTHSTPNQDIS